MRVEISLSPGLSFAANQPEAPAGTTLDTTTGIWNMGTTTALSTILLPVAVNLTADSLADLPLEERCLTAKLVNAVPWFTDDPSKRLNDAATACLGRELLSSGTMDLIDYYPCINDTSTPCTSTGTLELVMARRVGNQFEFRQPESFIVHVPDPDGRFSKNGSLVWSTVNLMNLRHTQTKLTDSWSIRDSGTVTAPGGGDAPGRWLLTDPDDSATTLDLLDAMDSSTVTNEFFDLSDIGTDPTQYFLNIKVDFWALGTYEALLGIHGRLSGTTYTGSGTYIFHVGPVADLAVRDGGANPGVPSGRRAFAIVAVNRGPDDAPAVKVTVTGLNASDYVSHSATAGSFDSATGIWTIGELRETGYQQAVHSRDGEVLTIVTSAATDAEISAEITNTQDYQVCIDSSHDDVELSSPSEMACTNEDSTNTWHTAKYYDYVSGNNTATSTAKVGSGADLPELQAPEPKTAAIVVEWDEIEEVLNRPVTHYEVRPSDAPCQTPALGTKGTAVFGTTYVDADLEPGDERCYYVRAVNMQMVAGPWSAPRSATTTVSTSTVPMVTPPGKPAGLTATVSNVSDIVLTWTAPSDGAAVDRYEIEYSADGMTDWRPLDNKIATTTYTDSGADYGETRHYRVRAVETQGHAGEWSDTDDATTENPPPGVPTSVSAVAGGQTGIIVWWLPPAPQGAPATHYEVASSDPPCQTPATSTAVFGTTYVDADLEPGDERCYYVRAVNMKMVAGPWSAPLTGMLEEPEEPPVVTAGAPDKPVLRAVPNEGKRREEILVSWDKPIENGSPIVSYALEVSDAGRNGPWSDSGATLDGDATSWVYTGLNGATRKFYRLRATNMCDTEDLQRECHSLWSEPVDATTDQPGKPGQPTGVNATPDGDFAIDVSWLAPEDDGGADITRYELQWSPDGASNWRSAGSTPDGETLTFKQSGLGIGITRYYRVAARNSRGLGAWSDPPHAFAMTLAGVPDRPNLTARDKDANTIELSWTVPADNGSPIVRYELEWSPNGSDDSWAPLTNPSAADTSYSDAGLDPGTERHYRIRAVNGATPGEGSWSTVHKAVTPPVVPGAPTLRAEANGQNAITLGWEPPFDDGGADITSYELHVSTDGGSNYSRLTSPSASARSYTHGGLLPSDERHYKLRARNRAGLGEFSQPAYGKTLTGVPAAPSLTARANGASEIKLSWTKPDDRGSDILRYEIEESDDGNDWNFLSSNIPDNDSEYVHTGLVGGTTKHYHIRAINANGEGQWSSPRSARTDAGGPEAPVLTLSVIGDNQIDLSWTEPANNGSSIRGYRVERSADGEEPWERLSSNNRTRTYSDDDLYRGMTRYYRVAAFNGAGTGPYSDVESATTTGDPATVPAAPALLRFSELGRSHVTIAWDPPEDNGGAPVTGYEYEAAVPCEDDPNTPENESERNCGFGVDGGTATTATSARISGLTTDGNYDFRVRAVNLVGKGEWAPVIYAILRPSTSAQVQVSPTTITVNEGATVTYTIRLSTAPPHPAQASIQPRGGEGGYNDIEEAAFEYNQHVLLPSGWTHPDPDEAPYWSEFSYRWNKGVRVTFTAPEDMDTDDEVAVMHHFVIPVPYDHYKPCRQDDQAERVQCEQDWDDDWADSPYRYLTGASVKVIVRDND